MNKKDDGTYAQGPEEKHSHFRWHSESSSSGYLYILKAHTRVLNIMHNMLTIMCKNSKHIKKVKSWFVLLIKYVLE